MGEHDDAAAYEDRVKIIASGCDAHFLMDEARVREKLATKPEVIKLVTFSRIDPSKGVEYSIRGAAKAARNCDCQLHLDIVGMPSSPEYVALLNKECESLPENLQVEMEFKDRISPEEEKKEMREKEDDCLSLR